MSNKWVTPDKKYNHTASTSSFSSTFEERLKAPITKTNKYQHTYNHGFEKKPATEIKNCRVIGVYNTKDVQRGIFERTYQDHSPDRKELFTHEMFSLKNDASVERKCSLFSKGDTRLESKMTINYRKYKK
ncbi:MAG: hypothetical protein ACRYGG_02305 [Janthinobacterium lividum]